MFVTYQCSIGLLDICWCICTSIQIPGINWIAVYGRGRFTIEISWKFGENSFLSKGKQISLEFLT